MRYLFILSLMLAFAITAEANQIKMASKAAYTKTENPVREFLQSECGEGKSEGCQNLGILHLEYGQKEKANTAFAKACSLGSSESCRLKY